MSSEANDVASIASKEQLRARFAGLRVAIVHYWLVGPGGGENVVRAMLDILPQADVFTLVAKPSYSSELVARERLHTSFLQYIPGSSHFHRALLPLAPLALENLNLDNYDLIVSSESGPAKGVLVPLNAVHICYCHSPMRYIWDQYHQYSRSMGRAKRLLFSLSITRLRVWDVTTAMRVDHFIANSCHVAKRIAKYYRRSSTVIYPPVDVEEFKPRGGAGKYYLITGRHVSYKRIDLAIEACNRLRRELVITGTGPETERLRRIAGPTIKFVGQCSFEQLKENYAYARAFLMPGEEDFGIAPVEAMASGRPVIAFASGGATETVIPGVSGLLFNNQTADGLAEAITRFEAQEGCFQPDVIRSHALGFSRDRFFNAFANLLTNKLEQRTGGVERQE